MATTNSIKTNGNEKKWVKRFTDYYEGACFAENVKLIKRKQIACCPNAEQTKAILNSFDIDLQSVEVCGITYLAPTTASSRVKNRMKFIEQNGYDPEDEK